MAKPYTKIRNHTAPHGFSATEDPKLLLIKQRINQIASNMKSPLRAANKLFHKKETRIRTPPKKESENIEEFLLEHGLENYLKFFQENQLTMEDLPYLTKDDLVDMKLPIGPRNRLLKILETFENKGETSSRYESSPKRVGLKDEVEKFMQELSQFSKRGEKKNYKNSSRSHSPEMSFDSENASQQLFEGIFSLLQEISEKQNFMIKAIEENQKSVSFLKQQFGSSKKAIYTNPDY